MKSSSIKYPFQAAVNLFESILKKEGLTIFSADAENGRIRAIAESEGSNDYRMIDVEVIPQKKSKIRVNVFVDAIHDIYINTITNDERRNESRRYEVVRASCVRMEDKLMKSLIK